MLNTNVSQNAEQFVRHPLRKEAEHLEIQVNGQIAAKIDRSASEDFVALGSGAPLGEFRSDQHLTIQTVVLEGDGLWRFSDGKNKFRAEIEDKRFLQRVRQGAERFGRGDILRVRLRSKQEKIRGQLRTSHSSKKSWGMNLIYRRKQHSFERAVARRAD